MKVDGCIPCGPESILVHLLMHQLDEGGGCPIAIVDWLHSGPSQAADLLGRMTGGEYPQLPTYFYPPEIDGPQLAGIFAISPFLAIGVEVMEKLDHSGGRLRRPLAPTLPFYPLLAAALEPGPKSTAAQRSDRAYTGLNHGPPVGRHDAPRLGCRPLGACHEHQRVVRRHAVRRWRCARRPPQAALPREVCSCGGPAWSQPPGAGCLQVTCPGSSELAGASGRRDPDQHGGCEH